MRWSKKIEKDYPGKYRVVRKFAFFPENVSNPEDTTVWFEYYYSLQKYVKSYSYRKVVGEETFEYKEIFSSVSDSTLNSYLYNQKCLVETMQNKLDLMTSERQ